MDFYERVARGAASCKKCGGGIIGDGYTVAYHCEYAEEETYIYHEPDASTVYCNYED